MRVEEIHPETKSLKIFSRLFARLRLQRSSRLSRRQKLRVDVDVDAGVGVVAHLVPTSG